MAAAARSTGVTVKRADAERLPFKDGWFDRVVARMVVHLLDRSRAFAEAHRVLVPGGRVALASMDPAWFDEHWLLPWFPTLVEIDRGRFPSGEALAAELDAAGFEPRVERLAQEVSMSREETLAKLRGRAFSTFDLIPDDEYRAGLARAEAELPGRVAFRRVWLIAAATRG
jgi:SAM-dependent methyltransferase